jgi:hypothetical protein
MSRKMVLALAFLSSCIGAGNIVLSSIGDADTNYNNMAVLKVGMDCQTVFTIMSHPYRQEAYELDGDSYEILYYVTRATVLGQTRMVPRNVTPLVFKNGRLMGWGWPYWDLVINKEKAIDFYDKPKPKAPDTENLEIERTLAPSATSFLSMACQKTAPAPPPSPSEEAEDGREKTPYKPLDEEDDEMLDEADDQNFNYW